MVGKAFIIKENDTRRPWRVPFVENFGEADANPMDFTDVTAATFLMREAGAPGAPDVTGTATWTVAGSTVPPATRPEVIVEYVWAPGDLTPPGEYDVEVQLTYSDGGVETVPNNDYFRVTIKEDLGP